MTRAIFFDRDQLLVRCQLAGMNEKGEPQWLTIEQGKETMTLADVETQECRNQHYKLLCLEGEEVGTTTLMRILCSFIQGEIEGWSTIDSDISNFVVDMKMHQVTWNQKVTVLYFRIIMDPEHEGNYYLSISQDRGRYFYGAVSAIEDPDKLLQVLDDFCCMLEDSLHIEEVYSIIDIRDVDRTLFSEILLSRFKRVIDKKD